MAVPKRRKSHSKSGMSRAHHYLKPIKLVACPECKNKTLPHRVCEHCGVYQKRSYRVEAD